MADADQTRADEIRIDRVSMADTDQIIALDERVTQLVKPDYWPDMIERFSTRRQDERFFFVAKDAGDEQVLGYIVGQVRGWEFGSEPSGWVFGFAVEPDTRQQGIGEQLFTTLSDAFIETGVKSIRTMVPRQNPLHMAFFRSEGMVAGPYIQLEMELGT